MTVLCLPRLPSLPRFSVRFLRKSQPEPLALPYELWSEIFKMLDNAMLVAVSRVSRAFNGHAIPIYLARHGMLPTDLRSGLLPCVVLGSGARATDYALSSSIPLQQTALEEVQLMWNLSTRSDDWNTMQREICRLLNCVTPTGTTLRSKWTSTIRCALLHVKHAPLPSDWTLMVLNAHSVSAMEWARELRMGRETEYKRAGTSRVPSTAIPRVRSHFGTFFGLVPAIQCVTSCSSSITSHATRWNLSPHRRAALNTCASWTSCGERLVWLDDVSCHRPDSGTRTARETKKTVS
ncbi:hypothetical protein B0H14DRAFT_2958684, partial [Mycena olivaceomarginata]